jgi:hypothetical protein
VTEIDFEALPELLQVEFVKSNLDLSVQLCDIEAANYGTYWLEASHQARQQTGKNPFKIYERRQDGDCDRPLLQVHESPDEALPGVTGLASGAWGGNGAAGAKPVGPKKYSTATPLKTWTWQRCAGGISTSGSLPCSIFLQELACHLSRRHTDPWQHDLIFRVAIFFSFNSKKTKKDARPFSSLKKSSRETRNFIRGLAIISNSFLAFASAVSAPNYRDGLRFELFATAWVLDLEWW